MNVDRTDSEENTEIPELTGVVVRAARTLRPLQPAPAFRARLRDNLMLAAHHQQAHRLLVLESRAAKTLLPAKGNWGWVIGAAALGSAAGLIAVLLRTRVQTKPHAQPQMPH
ncbi:MAG: hypothetical protein KGJ80_01990 [Chloroflexota bacterium]|nr:hypothetical protein [Chloroflexota bacterium]